jgi:hypothetical protein
VSADGRGGTERDDGSEGGVLLARVAELVVLSGGNRGEFPSSKSTHDAFALATRRLVSV